MCVCVQVTGGVSRTHAASSAAAPAEQQQQPAVRGADGGLLSQALDFLHHMMRGGGSGGGGGGGGAHSAGQQQPPQRPSLAPSGDGEIEKEAAAAAPQLSSGPQGFAACAVRAPAWGGRWRWRRSRAVPSLGVAVRAAAEGAHEEGAHEEGERQGEGGAEGGSGAAAEVAEMAEVAEEGAGRRGSKGKEKVVQLDGSDGSSAHRVREAMHAPGVAARRAVDNKAQVVKARQAAEQLRQRVRAAAIDRRGDRVEAVKVRRGGRADL